MIDQRGIAGNPPAVANKAQRLRQISEIPELDAAALKPRAVRRERELRRLAQLGTQRREVAALSKLLAGGIDHTDVRLQVLRGFDRAPSVIGQGFAQAFCAELAQRLREWKASIARIPFRRFEKSGDDFGHRHQAPAPSLRQRTQVPRRLLSHHPGHEP